MAVIGFSKEFPKQVDPLGRLTYFQEKILRGYLDFGLSDKTQEYIDRNQTLVKRVLETCSPKIHTIRKKGKANRKAGIKMHPSISVRTEDQYQFAPEIEIKKVTPLKFTWSPIINGRTTLTIKIGKNEFRAADTIAGMVVNSHPLLLKLSQNDGFNNVKNFLKYFDKNGNYELLSWTDFEYFPKEEKE